MRVAFLILNHREPTQLLRLMETLRRELPESPIVVHNDKFRAHVSASSFEHIGNSYLLTSETPIVWGDFSLVDVYWRSMAWMIKNIRFDWLVLLSGQDYPIKPLSTLGASLAATGADVLLRATPINELSKKRERINRRRRYMYQYRLARSGQAKQPSSLFAVLRAVLRRHTGMFVDVINNVQPCVQVYKFSAHVPWRIGWRARSTPFTREAPCWFGSVWITLSYRAAKFVENYTQDRPDYVSYFRHTVHPDESATATIVCNARHLGHERRNIHYVRWSNPRTGHPDVLTEIDLPQLLSAPEYFARKFDIATDAAILDKLDEALDKARARAHVRKTDDHIQYDGGV